MKKEQLKRIFEFLEEKEQQNPPFLWKHISGEPLTERDLNIEGDLNLTYSNITSLPKGLKVSGTLDLRRTILTSLPKGLKVGGDLNLYNTKITSLPEGLKVLGGLDLRLSNITSLPEGLEVGENLYIRHTELKQYLDDELRDMIKPGFIKGKIIR